MKSLSSPILTIEEAWVATRLAVAHVQGRGKHRRVHFGTVVRVEGAGASALHEGLETLRQAGGALPKQAVLLSSEAVPASVELPRAIGDARTPERFNEAVSWELQPLIEQQVGARRLGALLLAHGWMTPEQIAEVVQAQQVRRQPTSDDMASAVMGMIGSQRFGEIAVELGLVESWQIECCIEQQQKDDAGAIDSPDDVALACGWRKARQETSGPGLPADETVSRWLVSGMPSKRLDQWGHELSKVGIKLARVYPLLSPAVAAIDFEALGDSARRPAVLDARPDAVACVSVGEQGLPTDLQADYHGDRGLRAQACLATLPEDMPTGLWVNADDGHAADDQADDRLCDDLAQMVDYPVSPIRLAELPATFDDAAPPGAAMVGAARHSLGLVPDDRLSFINPHGHPKPLTRRRGFFTSVVVALVLGAVMVSEALLFLSSAGLEAEIDALRGQRDTLEIRIEEIEELTAKAKGLQDTLTQAKQEQVTLFAHRALIDERLPQRVMLMPSVFNMLPRAVVDGVVIDGLNAEAPEAITLQGWAIDQGHSSEFTYRLTGEAQAIDYDVRFVQGELLPGPFGETSYYFKLLLIPALVAEEEGL